MLKIGIQSLNGFHAGHACKRDALCVNTLRDRLAMEGGRSAPGEAEKAQQHEEKHASGEEQSFHFDSPDLLCIWDEIGDIERFFENPKGR